MEGIIPDDGEETSRFLDVLQDAPLFHHKKSTAIIWAIMYCLLLVNYAILAAAAPWALHTIYKLTPSVLCSCATILLIVTGVFQRHMVYQVQKIRLQGFYILSQKLKHIVHLPFSTAAYGTALMLLIMVWKPHLLTLSTSALLRIIMLVEAVCAGSFMSIYIGYLRHYNSLDSHPDVLNSLYSPLQDSSSVGGYLRYYDGGGLLDQQVALLQYQRENIHILGEEVIRLQECLRKYEGSVDRGTSQVDLAHLLAARDQELRTLSAEMNQVESELRLARSIIAEKDNETAQVQATNHQFVEENERLRGILGEWSSRAAKLERALEMERSSKQDVQIATISANESG